MTKIKICGIQNIDFAVAASDAGADYLGFNFVDYSRRSINLSGAKAIVTALKDYSVTCVAVVMNLTASEIERICKETGINTVQIYGESPKNMSNDLSKFFVISVNNEGFLQNDIKTVYERCRTSRDHIILDYESPGSGYSYPINNLMQQTKGIPYFLAGGIKKENVLERLQATGAMGIDAASGVETIEQCRELIATVRGL